MNDDLDPTTISPQGAYEPAADAAPAAPVVPPAAAARGGRYRWAVALGVVAVVVAATLFAISLFTGRAANGVVLGYVPSDTIMYGEARLDLPGDQRAAVGQFLSKFPGFADQSAMETKIDEVLDRLVGGASDGTQAFSTDIKPWFGGELAFSVGALPDPNALSGTDPSAVADARFLVLVSVKDEAAARAWFDAVIAETGASSSTESYGGATLTLFGGEGEPQGAFALLAGKVAVAGDPTSVRAAVDTNGTSGFASKPEPQAALGATTGDHVGFVYIALRPLMEWSSAISGAELGGAMPATLMDLVPDWGAFALRVEGDALVMEAIAPSSEATAETDNRTSAVADHVPNSAVVLTISRDYGAELLKVLDAYRSDATMKPIIDTVDQAMGVLGGTDAAIGWVGDLGITVTRADGALEGGVVIVPTDPAAAERLFTSLRTLVSLGGVTMGVTIRDEAYAGTTITIVDLGDVGDIVGQAGLSPEQLGSLPTGRVELAYAITDKIVVLGSSPGFVRHVLDTTAATSIASNERYKALADRAGQGTAAWFADLTAIRELIESALVNADAADLADYEQNVKPFLTPFDAMVGSNGVQGELNRSTIIVTVK